MGGSRQLDWIPLLFAVVLALGLVQVVHYGRHLGRPFAGYMADRAIIENYWFVGPSTPPWWEGIAQAGLRPGDRLITIDGEPYGRDQAQHFAAAHAAGRSSVTLTIGRHGGGREMVEAPLVPFRLAHALDLKLPGLINGFGFLVLAVVVYAARPRHPVNRLFAVASGLIVAHRWFVNPGVFLDEGGLTNFLDLAGVTTAPFVGPLTIHLALLFPQRSHRLSRQLLTGLYGLAAIMAACFAASRLVWWRAGWIPAAPWLDAAGYWGALVLLGAGALFFVGRYIRLRQQSRPGSRLHRQVSVIVTGFILTMPFLFLIIIEGFFTRSTYYPVGLNLRYLLLAVPLAFAYAILRYQTLRGYHPALLGVFIFGTSALVASVGDWLIRLILAGPSTAFVVPPFVPIFAVTLGAGVFWSTQSSWYGLFGRLMHRRMHNYRAAGRFARRLVGDLGAPDLPEQMAAALVEELELEQAAVWFEEGEGGATLAGQAGAWESPPPERLAVAAGEVATMEGPLRVGPAAEQWPGLWPLAGRGDVEVVAPLRVPERPLGLLALGRRWDEEVFDERDLEIVALIAQQAALFVLAARQIDELRQIPQRMAEAQEAERQRIARELHDTIQQLLGRLPFYLEVSRNSLRHDPEEAERLLAQSMADVQSAAQMVRQIQRDLAPRQLERGLGEPIRERIGHFCARTGLEVAVEIGPAVDEALSLQARHALYRVVQQALDNTAAHAEADRIDVTVVVDEGKVRFRIVDDGRGSSAAEREAARGRGSFGLQSMTARVQAQGGWLDLRSAPGEGTVVEGWLPAERRAEGPPS